ncbi:MAG TPA: hypothetical protein VEM96_12450 [Pyrinomonadaceae bacterium]|nr:hypothetical protein [Pyrinomonadaceae bacterium]
MARFCRVVAFVFWLFGLLTTVLVLVSRIARPLRVMLEERLELRSLLWLAGVFFLGAIATWAIDRTSRE